MAEQIKNLLIGIFVIAACAIIILMILFLHPSTGDEGRILRVRFANIDKISLGTRVTFGGKPVGEVVEIKELPEAITERLDYNGFVYVYELTLKVDSSTNVYNYDEIASRTSGLLGEKTVAITPKAPPFNKPLILVNDEILYAVESGTVEDTVRELTRIGKKFQTTLDNVNEILEDFKTHDLWAKVNNIGSNVEKITGSIDPEKIEKMVDNFHALSEKINESWKAIDLSIANFSEISGKVNSGTGTLGQVINNEDIYLKFNALLAKADTVLNDINHYGLLFHSDKGWQRLRARRLNLLNRLSTPQEFRNYFNDEMDQISTSLSRVYMVLDKSEEYPCCEILLENREYGKVYSELLRRVESLQESLKMYNQQAVDMETQKFELIE